MFLLLFLLAALIVGYLRGGRMKNYLRAPLGGILLPCAAFLIEAFLNPLLELFPWKPDISLMLCVLLQYALLFLFYFLNRKRPAIYWMGAGTLCNFAVIAANGFRMPVSQIVSLLPEFSETARRIASGGLPEYVIMDSGTNLGFLGDIIYVPGVKNGLGSLGDILLGLGVFFLILEIMGRGKSLFSSRRRKPPLAQ